MEFLPSSRTGWRSTLAGLCIALCLLVGPYDDFRDWNLLYDLFLHAYLTEQVAVLLAGAFALVGGLLMQRRVLGLLVAGYGAFLSLLAVTGLVWGEDATNLVAGVVIVVGFFVFMYVFGEGSEGRH